MNAPKYRRIAAKLALKYGIHLTRSKEFNDLDAGAQTKVRHEVFKIVKNKEII
jgi:uncharacterized protein YkvS